jgi:hypothetical protein
MPSFGRPHPNDGPPSIPGLRCSSSPLLASSPPVSSFAGGGGGGGGGGEGGSRRLGLVGTPALCAVSPATTSSQISSNTLKTRSVNAFDTAAQVSASTPRGRYDSTASPATTASRSSTASRLATRSCKAQTSAASAVTIDMTASDAPSSSKNVGRAPRALAGKRRPVLPAVSPPHPWEKVRRPHHLCPRRTRDHTP